MPWLHVKIICKFSLELSFIQLRACVTWFYGVAAINASCTHRHADTASVMRHVEHTSQGNEERTHRMRLIELLDFTLGFKIISILINNLDNK